MPMVTQWTRLLLRQLVGVGNDRVHDVRQVALGHLHALPARDGVVDVGLQTLIDVLWTRSRALSDAPQLDEGVETVLGDLIDAVHGRLVQCPTPSVPPKDGAVCGRNPCTGDTGRWLVRICRFRALSWSA